MALRDNLIYRVIANSRKWTILRASLEIKWYLLRAIGNLDSTTVSKTNKHMYNTYASDLACKKSTTKMMRGTRMWKRSHHSIAFMYEVGGKNLDTDV